MKETKFKQTEVGMIPHDWNVKTFGELFDMCTANIPIKDINQEFYVGTENMLQKKMGVEKNTAVLPYSKVREYQKNDILVSNIRPYLKKIWFADKDGGCSTDVLVFRAKDKNLYPSFLYNVVADDRFFNIVNENAIGTKMPRGDKNVIKQILFAIPPSIEEQQRIANALSDVDTLIANLEKLIAKKKNIKQGAMQQLLTGKKRLPGFGSDERTGSRPTDERRKECHSERSAKREVEESSGYKMTELGIIPSDWEVKTIKELGVFLGGGTPSTKNESFWKGNIPWISSADLSDDDIEHISMTRFISQEAVNCSATQICPQGTILIIARVGVGKLALSQQKVCTSQDFCNLIPSKENNSKFLAYALLPVMKQMANETQGTSIKGVAADEIKKVQISVPSSKAEQTAIANVFSDMDTEIATLETKLAKYRKLKTGMMQQLLTGKIRLVK